MKNTEYFRNKNILIIGLQRSGLSAANLLCRLSAKVSITDNQDNSIIRHNMGCLKSDNVKVEVGIHSRDFSKEAELVIISPGVPNDSLPVVWAKERGVPVISEIELGWMLSPAEIIAITGTCGKTTVTTLVGRMIESWGKRSFTCGNIGNPFTLEVEKMREGDFVALEVSSFQLENIYKFKPKIAVILNLSPNHLDRYNDMQEYIAAKERIFLNQDVNDYLLLNYDDELVRNLSKKAKSKVDYFKKGGSLNPNQEAVLAISKILNIEERIVFDLFKNFKGVEHRMEEVLEINGVKFINDSKSTTTEATVWALNNIPSPVILISGGREKGNDYSNVIAAAGNKVKSLVLIGEAKDRIRQAFKGQVKIFEAQDLKEAVNEAFAFASAGDTVLFSPMCKSFDMFSNYEERGRLFKEQVS
ncbi:MAG: UDP-N-acetylmuramoyl-L-alanine--D-glutamate ligase, partial [Candidatus Omnitrophica bacterium]|nr:UDP-N-acetylmuramoyl-L-alanine--D-glutamate ligase [Candidatus Omnitrophota bacterium]